MCAELQKDEKKKEEEKNKEKVNAPHARAPQRIHHITKKEEKGEIPNQMRVIASL